MELVTFNMSFYMSKRGVHTIDLIRQGLRKGTTRQYNSEIRLIKSLKHGQPVLFNRTNNYDEVVDSIIVFAINNIETNTVGYKVNGWAKHESLCAKWCELEGWDIDFAKNFLSSEKDLWQFQFSLYPPNYAYSPDNITELKDGEIAVIDSCIPYIL